MDKEFCRHVYEDVGYDVCPDCNESSRRIDWKAQHILHEDWIASGKAVAQGWWSI
jgi:hypothetical protein